MARFLEVAIPEPICLNESWENKDLTRVLVDDADVILGWLLRQKNKNISIEEITLS